MCDDELISAVKNSRVDDGAWFSIAEVNESNNIMFILKKHHVEISDKESYRIHLKKLYF